MPINMKDFELFSIQLIFVNFFKRPIGDIFYFFVKYMEVTEYNVTLVCKLSQKYRNFVNLFSFLFWLFGQKIRIFFIC